MVSLVVGTPFSVYPNNVTSPFLRLNILTLSELKYFVCDSASQSTKQQYMQEAPLPPCYIYCVFQICTILLFYALPGLRHRGYAPTSGIHRSIC